MIALDDATYQETKSIALGKCPRSPFLVELANWFNVRYAVKVLNFQFNKPDYLDRYRLTLVVDSTPDYRKMALAAPPPELPLLVFKKLALKYQLTAAANLENCFIAYADFSEEAAVEANWRAFGEVKALVCSQFPCVWDVMTIMARTVFFYNTDEEVETNEKNGTSAAIGEVYFSVLKKYDELNFFTRENILVDFDSKENLDRNYEGNRYYYEVSH